ncbi:MAG: D-2-hydroxyacid dehydrogenase [Caldilineaceae bacterium]
MKILLYYPFVEEDVAEFRRIAAAQGHEVIHASSDEEALAVAPEIEVILGRFPESVCAAAANLRWIQSFSAGMDKFLFPAMAERDEVMLSNMAGMYAPQGAEHAWAFLLALARGLTQAREQQKQHQWKAGSVVEITGMTLGIIGMGGFGMEMVKRAAGYNMTILAVDPMRTDIPPGVAELKPASKENIHSLLRRSDAVMMACPRTPETYHLISTEELALMKPTAYLINVTRGGIIDEDALVAALEAGEIAGAALDVTEKEPLPAESSLWDAPNLLLTPHRAGASQHRPQVIVRFFQEQLQRYLTGERPRNVIDKRRGY